MKKLSVFFVFALLISCLSFAVVFGSAVVYGESATFGNGFTYTGENIPGVNIYEGSTVSVVAGEDADKEGIPDGFTGDSVLVVQSQKSSFGMVFDFSPLNYKRSSVLGISFRLYIEKNSADSSGYPEVRIPVDSTMTSWILRRVVGSEKTGQWITISLTETEINQLCKGGTLGRFAFAVRSNGVAKMYIDSVNVDVVSPDTVPPVITVPVTRFKVTEGTYPDLSFISATDDSDVVEFEYQWSENALDYNGRLNVGNHTCTVKAVDPSDNVAQVVLNFEVVAETKTEVYSLIFRQKGVADKIVEYSKDTEKYIVIPEPETDEGYSVTWQDFELEYKVGQIIEAESKLMEYTVIYVADGNVIATKKYTAESIIENPEIPAKKGYDARWPQFELDNVTVTAEYTAIVYTADYYVGETKVASVTYTVEDENIVEPAVPERKFYDGFWEEHDLDCKNVIVKAKYTPTVYTITFVAEGNVVGKVSYTIEDFDFDLPEVPEKKGYTGEWEAHEYKFEDLTVNAVYTKKSDDSGERGDPGEKSGGCSSAVTSYSVFFVFLFAAALVFAAKRKIKK